MARTAVVLPRGTSGSAQDLHGDRDLHHETAIGIAIPFPQRGPQFLSRLLRHFKPIGQPFGIDAHQRTLPFRLYEAPAATALALSWRHWCIVLKRAAAFSLAVGHVIPLIIVRHENRTA